MLLTDGPPPEQFVIDLVPGDHSTYPSYSSRRPYTIRVIGIVIVIVVGIRHRFGHFLRQTRCGAVLGRASDWGEILAMAMSPDDCVLGFSRVSKF